MKRDGWCAAEFMCATARGPWPVAGYRRGYFGIDFRPILDRNANQQNWCGAWAITHIPTGLGITGIRGPFAWAAELAEQFAGMPINWSMKQPAVFQHARDRVRQAIHEKFATDDCIAVSALLAPWDFDIVMADAAVANDVGIGSVQ